LFFKPKKRLCNLGLQRLEVRVDSWRVCGAMQRVQSTSITRLASTDPARQAGVHAQEIGQPRRQPLPSSGNIVFVQIGLDCLASNEPLSTSLSQHQRLSYNGAAESFFALFYSPL